MCVVGIHILHLLHTLHFFLSRTCFSRLFSLSSSQSNLIYVKMKNTWIYDDTEATARVHNGDKQKFMATKARKNAHAHSHTHTTIWVAVEYSWRVNEVHGPSIEQTTVDSCGGATNNRRERNAGKKQLEVWLRIPLCNSWLIQHPIQTIPTTTIFTFFHIYFLLRHSITIFFLLQRFIIFLFYIE